MISQYDFWLQSRALEMFEGSQRNVYFKYKFK